LTTDLSPSDYDAFAPFYDAFTAASDYEHWAAQVLELVERHGLRGRSVLDVACGTGKSFLPLLRRGYEVSGCDFSPAMLAEAALKAPGVPLVPADLRRLPELGRFDLVTCVDDSLNYLRDGDELRRAFAGIAANLAPSGLFVFDLNTLIAYRSTFARDSVMEADGTLFVWRGESSAGAPEGCLATAVIEIFSPRDDGSYERVTTRHEQRHFPHVEVVELLERAGLRCVSVHGALDSGELVEHADEEAHLKVMYIARPMEGGAAK
jgi:SAM-dependent methyltransferase